MDAAAFEHLRTLSGSHRSERGRSLRSMAGVMALGLNERSASTSWLDEAEMSSRLASSHVGSFESDQNLVGGRHGGARGKMTDDVQEMANGG
jgi:hypothetical protein